MKYHQYLAILMAGSLAACGGGSGSSNTPAPNATVTSSASSAVIQQKTTVTQGMVTGFGSVIVNGVHYDVKNAAINVDGDAYVESDLGVGQMVRIVGVVDADGVHGKATKLEGESQLRGPIESIDLTTGVIMALGQSILLTPDTFYQDDVTPETLKVGDLIKVSAYTNADGDLVATRVDVKAGSAAQVKQLAGKIEDLDTTAKTFTLHGKTVDYSKATLASDITLADDLLVRVRGNLVADIFVAEGELQVSPLSIKHSRDIEKNAGLAVSGVVTELVAGSRFTLNDVTVIVNADTEYEGGVSGDISEGLFVKVHGALDANNNLVATEVKLILNPQVSSSGVIQGVDLVANTLTLNGVTFTISEDTSFHDSGRDKVRLFSLADLALGNAINVRGYKVAATATTPEHLVATRVHRVNPQGNAFGLYKMEVHGIIESAVESTLKVAGHTVVIDEDTDIRGFDTLAAFLIAAEGKEVEIKGVIEGEQFIATSIALEEYSHGERPDSHHSQSSHSAHSHWAHSDSSTSASTSSVAAGEDPSHSRSSKSASATKSSRAAHSDSSESERSASSKSAKSAHSRSQDDNMHHSSKAFRSKPAASSVASAASSSATVN